MKNEWKTNPAFRRILWLIPVALSALLLWRQSGRVEGVQLLMDVVLLLIGYAVAENDFRESKVPNTMVLLLLGAWVLILFPQLFLRTDLAISFALRGLAGFLLSGGLLLAVYYISRKGLGGGDVKFMAVSGLYLGVTVLGAMLYGSILCALTALVLILFKKITAKDTMPLIPFLYVGIVLTMFFQG